MRSEAWDWESGHGISGGPAVSSETQARMTKRFTEERRAEDRTELRLVARLAHPTGSIFGHLEDVSSGGASFVTTTLDPELEEGTDVVLILTSPANAIPAEVHCTAKIVRAEDFCDAESEVMTYAMTFDEALDLDVLVGRA